MSRYLRRLLSQLALWLPGLVALLPGGGPQRALVIGGSGRVGGSTVKWLDWFAKEEDIKVDLTVGGRSKQRFETMRKRNDVQCDFVEMDIDDPKLDLRGFDIVIHCAGPFQGVRKPKVLDAVLKCGGKYLDVCDETVLCEIVKDPKYQNIQGVVSAGIWPGFSALMARQACAMLDDVNDIQFDFFTAGTGGAGPTIVAATFLLLATPALNFVDGIRVDNEPWTQSRVVDFPTIGSRRTRLLDCPDVLTVCDALGGNLSCASRFATAPEIWNDLFGASKALLPRSLLANRQAMAGLAAFSEPVVRAVDTLVGSKNAIRVQVSNPSGASVTATHVHDDLEAAVGIATAAFAMDLLLTDDDDSSGILWPSELSPHRRDAVIHRILRAPGTLHYDYVETS